MTPHTLPDRDDDATEGVVGVVTLTHSQMLYLSSSIILDKGIYVEYKGVGFGYILQATK